MVVHQARWNFRRNLAQSLGIPFSTEAGSKNHLALVNVFKKYGLFGSEAQTLLEKMGLEEYIGIGANANTIPLTGHQH
jgi:hypothetical protein